MRHVTFSLCVAMLISFVPRCYGREDVAASRSIHNVRAFAKLYGYVKYFHPSDEASAVDWGKFAVYGVGQVKNAKDAPALTATLNELFLPIAPTIQIYESGQKPKSLRETLPQDTTGLKVVAWQHLGPGWPATSQSVYRSLRLNRENRLPIRASRFATVTQTIDARDLRGKRIKLKAFVKADVRGSGNRGQLWLRVDRAAGKRGFFDNMQDRPITSQQWKEYQIQGEVADDATRIALGCFLMGTGEVWVDGVQLLVKGGQGTWQVVDLKNPGFEQADDHHRPASWFAASPNHVYRVTEDAPREGKACLLIASKSIASSGALFDERPEIGQVISKPLGRGLSCQIPLALYSDGGGTLGKDAEYPFAGLSAKLDARSAQRPTADDENVRLGNVVIAWNVFQHFYGYFDVVDVDWNQELTDSLRGALADKDQEDFYYTLSKLVAKLQDGHGYVFHQTRIRLGQARLPLGVGWIEDRVVITACGTAGRLVRGDVIVSIDGKKAEQVLLDAERYISGSPQWKRVKSLRQFGQGVKGTKAKLAVKRGNKTFSLEVQRTGERQTVEHAGKSIEELADGVFYVDLSRAPMKELDARIEDLAAAKAVVFDLRGYPNGNHMVLCHLLSEADTSKAWMRIPRIIYPDREKLAGYQDSGWQLKPSSPRIKGKVVFLTDASAISYAESLLSFVEHYKLGEIVGRPTAGANGNVASFTLPGGFAVGWTGMRVLKHDGSQHHLIGVRPTVPVSRTIKGVTEGRDEFLQKALEIAAGAPKQ